MPVTVNWGTKVISVTQSFLTPLGGTSYSLDTNAFRLALRDLEDDEAGMPFLPTHNHNTVVLLGGIQYARIIEMINGYTITFQDVGTPYKVFLTGSNNNILDVTNLNNVSVAPNNSAGLVQMSEIQHGVFDGGVTVDVLNGYAGTIYPTGTPVRPVNNMPDAITIAGARGFSTIYIKGDITLGTGDDVTGKLLIGENALRTLIIVNPIAVTSSVEIRNAAVTGTMDGTTILRDCYVFDATYITGFIFQCALAGTITLGGAVPAHILSCYAGSGEVTIDMGGSGQGLNLSNWTGDVRISNKTGTDPCQMHVQTASVTLDATVTNGGGIHIDGVGSYVNESLITPDHSSMLSPETVAAGVLSAAQASPMHTNIKQVNDIGISGAGTTGSPWGPV